MPDPFREIWRPHRYKVFYGGRGSGKSWAVAQALIVMSDLACIRVLCCREIQNSIRDSSYQVLKDTAERHGIAGRFSFLESEIRHNVTGSRFIFKGLCRNEQSVKSTEGIDVCRVEEAQTVSEVSWEVLIPTIRKPGSEIWVTFNPLNADAARPETISYLANRCGYRISAVKKWQDSVEDGVAYLKSFEKIVVHPRCKHAADEFKLYSYKIDKVTQEVLPVFVDKNNHCLDALRYALDGYIT